MMPKKERKKEEERKQIINWEEACEALSFYLLFSSSPVPDSLLRTEFQGHTVAGKVNFLFVDVSDKFFSVLRGWNKRNTDSVM